MYDLILWKNRRTEKANTYAVTQKPVQSSEQMGEMVDSFTLASPHVGGVADIQQSENDPWDRNDAEQVKFAPRIEKDRGEHNSCNGT